MVESVRLVIITVCQWSSIFTIKNIQVLEIWGSFWRDVMIAASGSKVSLVNIDKTRTIQALGRQLGFSQAKKIVMDIEQSIERMDRFVNIRLLLEVLFLKLPVVPGLGK